jgi:putative ABC transport system permease protein
MLEGTVGHRMDRWGIPWAVAGVAAFLAIIMSTGSAWWPARAISRLPVVVALSGRPPRPTPPHRSALLGLALLAAGTVCLVLAETKRPLLIVAGTACVGLGILFASAPAIGLSSRVASRAVLPIRLSLRDLSRHRARSGAALASISLALGISVVILGVTGQWRNTAITGNLSDRQMLITFPDTSHGDGVTLQTPARQRDAAMAVARIAALVGHPRLVPLDVPYESGAPAAPSGGQMVPMFGVPVTDAGRAVLSTQRLYVANPELLRLLGVDPGSVRETTDLLATRPGRLTDPLVKGGVPASFQPMTGSRYGSLPTALLTAGGLARHHWTQVPVGWLAQSARPLTTAELGAARDAAVQAGLIIETRSDQATLGDIQTIATAVGLLLALAVLAATVGLIRVEASADVRTLTAAGATSTIRRSLTATTAGLLSLLGALLGTAGACLGLAAAYRSHLHVLTRLPPADMAVIVVGVPLAAAAAGWLLAGRGPGPITRRLGD